MSASDMEIEREAVGWLMRVNDPAFEAWEAWEAWMAADSRHREIYWRLASNEAVVVDALRSAAPGPERRTARRHVFSLPRRPAIAAAFAVVALGGAMFAWSGRPQPWVVETAPGEQRTVSFSDGSRVHLAGATRLTLDRRAPREVALEAGRALFEVVHDEQRPFRVEVADATLTDLGTTFDVTLLRSGARVSVSEGIVRVDQAGASATLNPGDSVLTSDRGLDRRSVSPEDVAGWREGRLSYIDESLSVVAQDLERALDRPIRLAPSLAARRFSGSLSTRGDAVDLKARLSRLLDVTVTEDGDGWRLDP